MAYNRPEGKTIEYETRKGGWLEAMIEVVPRYDRELVYKEALKARHSPSVYEHERSVKAPGPVPGELCRVQMGTS